MATQPLRVIALKTHHLLSKMFICSCGIETLKLPCYQCLMQEFDTLKSKHNQIIQLLDEVDKKWVSLVRDISIEIEARHWITEGRGAYAWDDDRYRWETANAFSAIKKIHENARCNMDLMMQRNPEYVQLPLPIGLKSKRLRKMLER
jgi:hypothetical protein